MTVHFWIPGPLQSMTGGRSQVDVETSGNSLRDALESLFAAHPGIRDRILTVRGEIREHGNVFVGKSEARLTGGLATSLADGVKISIIPAISGGCVSAGRRREVDQVHLPELPPAGHISAPHPFDGVR